MSDDFGTFFREKRLARGFTLRAFCERFGFDTAYISRLENNKLTPPSKDKLSALATALGLQPNTKDWITFFDLAHKAKNELPSDIKEEASKAVSLLPAFLRTPDGKKVSKERVERLIRFLQKDGGEVNQE